MGYRVEYDISGKSKTVNLNKESRRKIGKRIAIAIITILVFSYAVADGWIKDILFPGYTETTGIAAEKMLNRIRYGESIGDAVATFCKEIVADDR